MTYLYRAGGGMAPSAPPWIRYWSLSEALRIHHGRGFENFSSFYLRNHPWGVLDLTNCVLIYAHLDWRSHSIAHVLDTKHPKFTYSSTLSPTRRKSRLSQRWWFLFNNTTRERIWFRLLPTATKLRRLCFYRHLSVHRGWGCLPQCMPGNHPPPWADTPQRRHPPRSRQPPDQTPQTRPPPQSRHPPADPLTGAATPLEQTPPLGQTPPGVDTPWSRQPPPLVTVPSDKTPPEIRPLLRTVRIVLECILVSHLLIEIFKMCLKPYCEKYWNSHVGNQEIPFCLVKAIILLQFLV